ncbi:SLC13 family permease [Legionella londiniensis]|uniref:Putative transporter n=1 Tax=Legionella londiniensis TaxID=45068 RepID=A0A0W0VQC0_9GAMM|nr:SLC13 family permease [Legionella londiniensis]KTD22363.1 putative transporter [Legionella londiniensis]STX93063.1 putative citrate transporter [Legionella londiniensis]
MLQQFNYQFHLIITLIVLLFALISFIREKIPAYITALLVMAALLFFGVISTGEALSVFSNSAPITIAAMFVIGAALKNTGVIDLMVHYIMQIAEKRFWLAIAGFYGFVLIASAFMNNTPIVIIMTPVIIMITRKFNQYPSKFLIPLSYIAIMGGTCTLIGTSTNLLVNGIVISSDVPSFNIFDITIPGLIMAAVGILFLLAFGHRLLPVRPLFTEEIFTPENGNKHFIANAMVLPDSRAIGKTLDELGFPESKDCFVIDIIRKDKSLSETLPTPQKNINLLLRTIPLQPFDRILIRSNKEKLIAINKLQGLILGEREGLSALRETKETIIMEGIVGPDSRLINHHISSSWIRRRYNCHIWALHRDNKIIKKNFYKIPLKFGDVLLIEGTHEDLDDFFKNEEVLSLTKFKKTSFDKKGLIALFTIISVVVFSALNFMPITGLALIGAILVIVTNCITAQKAYESIDWRILMLIFGMLSLSTAMENTGIAEYIVQNTAAFTAQFGPRAILASIYMMTSILTEFMTNNAVAVLITPLIISLTIKLGLNPEPFIVAIMFAASASFATPLGYQTNTYVYNAGNYQFRDFLKIGIPMNIINFITAIIVIPLFWDLKRAI